MSADRYEQVKANPKFHQLVKQRSRWVWSLSAVILTMYFSFILLIAFSPEWLGQSLSGGVITIGIPIGVFIIVMAFILTGIYVHKANKDFDRINNEIISEIKQ
ncbi:hypothetical protein A9Q78_07455 [Methylophaga sp. 41_12_T18]|nr:hypothetical protein A9Q78_07455 [Methylophaga sp. 41_12_T18]